MPVTDVIITSTASPSEAALMRLGIAHTATAHVLRAASLLGEDFAMDRGVPAIHVTCRRVYARVLVQAELEDLIPNPQLVTDIEKAISSHDQAEQIEALRSALRRWGSNIATHIEIGCALVSTSVFETASHIPVVSLASDRGCVQYSFGFELVWKHAQSARFPCSACRGEICAQCTPCSSQQRSSRNRG
jgi:hypothetical protein